MFLHRVGQDMPQSWGNGTQRAGKGPDCLPISFDHSRGHDYLVSGGFVGLSILWVVLSYRRSCYSLWNQLEEV